MSKHKQNGFTIVELLIVIVIIAILAAITIVAFNGIQNRSYNAQRKSDLAMMAKALEMHYADNGRYPATLGVGAPTDCLSSSGWNCWGYNSTNRLVSTDYASKIPQDPQWVDNNACNRPNNYISRMYGYSTNASGTGYRLATYMPGLSTSDPNYFDGSVDVGCLNFANYMLRKNM